MVKAGFNKKVALEGMSRGGLIVYNWAAQNPEKVACIYADAPVMDFKSCHPENIVIAIGINNLISGKDSPENTAEGIIAVANEVRKQFPESRIILLGLFPSGKEQQSKVRTQCDKIHDILQHHRFEKVEYINPTKWFTEADGTMKDGLYGNDYIHFTGEGYKVAATEIAKILAR